MKRRALKKQYGREMRAANASFTRERGDHRRWLWMAMSPWVEEDAQGRWEVHFDPRFGRLYRQLPDEKT